MNTLKYVRMVNKDLVQLILFCVHLNLWMWNIWGRCRDDLKRKWATFKRPTSNETIYNTSSQDILLSSSLIILYYSSSGFGSRVTLSHLHFMSKLLYLVAVPLFVIRFVVAGKSSNAIRQLYRKLEMKTRKAQRMLMPLMCAPMDY